MAEFDEMTGLSVVQGLTNALVGLQRLKSGMAELELKDLRKRQLMRELEGPSESEKWAEKQRAEQVKLMMTTFSQLSKESTPATKGILMEQMKTLWGVMTPFERTAAKMIYDHSPINPLEQKKAWWEQTFKPPKVTADPEKDIYAYAMQIFAQDDYFQQMNNFVSGTPVIRSRIKALADGVFGLRGSDDKLHVVTGADLGLRQIADEHGVSVGKLLSDGGIVFGAEREVAIGKNVFKVQSRFDAVGKKHLAPNVVPIRTEEKGLVGSEVGLQKFALAYGLKGEGPDKEANGLYKLVRGLLDEGQPMEWISKNVLKQQFPDYNFAIVDPGDFSKWRIWGGYSPSDTEVLTFWRGEELVLDTKDGKQVSYYYDHKDSKVYDTEGRMISGSLYSFAAKVGSKTLQELKDEASRKKGKGIVSTEKGSMDKGSLKDQARNVIKRPPKENLTVKEFIAVSLSNGWSPERAAQEAEGIQISSSDGKFVDFESFKEALKPLYWTNDQLWKVYKGTWNALNAAGDFILGIKVPGTSRIKGEQ